MAGEYDNTNRGVLFINNRRATDRHPTMTGSLNVDGVEYWISAWTKHKQSDGEKYLSLSITLKENKEPSWPAGGAMSGMDDVPF